MYTCKKGFILIKTIILFIATIILSSCGGSSNSGACSVLEQNRYVYNYMQDNYLWYSQMPQVDYTKYLSPYDIFVALKVPQDRWSFIVDKKVFDDYFSGKGYIGFGFKFSKIGSGYYLQMVFANSPAKRANLQRGDQILAINGKNINSLSKNDVIDLLGDREIGLSRTFKIKKRDGSIVDINLSKAQIDVPSVIKSKIIDSNGHKIGYLLFDKFIETSFSELDSAFSNFKAQGIDSLVIDLRYNGGGLVSVAEYIASLIRSENSGDLLFKLQFNNKHRDRDRDYYFNQQTNSLDGINKVYFLTTNSTCSASEAVINGLKPYIDVKIIGSTTCGKPVGMVGGEFCEKYIVPIEFEILNSQNQGRYFSGITPTCQINDDITHSLGDMSESMLKEAINQIDGNSCSSSNKMVRKAVSENKNYIRSIDSVMNAY